MELFRNLTPLVYRIGGEYQILREKILVFLADQVRKYKKP